MSQTFNSEKKNILGFEQNWSYKAKSVKLFMDAYWLTGVSMLTT